MQQILLIVKQDVVRDRLKRGLEEAGFEVYAVKCGQDGLQIIAGGGVRAVVCGADLPDVDGLDLLGQLQMRRDTMHIPTVFLASQVTLEDVRRCVQIRVDDYLPDTVDAHVLADTLGAVLQTSLHIGPGATQASLTSWLDSHHEKMAQSLVEEIQLPLHNLRTLTTGARRLAAPPLQSMIDNIDAMVDQAIATMDLLLIDIFPAKVNQLGLMPALYMLIERYRANTVRPVHLQVLNVGLQAMPDDIQQTNLLLIVRDLLTHYLQVLGAASLTLQLHTLDDKAQFELVVAEIAGEVAVDLISLSLLTAQQRAKMAGGDLRFTVGLDGTIRITGWLLLKMPADLPVQAFTEPFVMTFEEKKQPPAAMPFVDDDLPADTHNYTELTPREREVFQGVASGMTNAEMAAMWQISIRTVETHRANMMNKLELRDKVDVVRYAIKHELISIDDL